LYPRLVRALTSSAETLPFLLPDPRCLRIIPAMRRCFSVWINPGARYFRPRAWTEEKPKRLRWRFKMPLLRRRPVRHLMMEVAACRKFQNCCKPDRRDSRTIPTLHPMVPGWARRLPVLAGCCLRDSSALRIRFEWSVPCKRHRSSIQECRCLRACSRWLGRPQSSFAAVVSWPFGAIARPGSCQRSTRLQLK